MRATSVFGTAIISAWLAQPPPAQATRSPRTMPSTPRPTASTTPADEYPRGVRDSSRSRTAATVDRIPLALALSRTFFVRSGRARAFAGRLFAASSSLLRSVPALMSEHALATSTHPSRTAGAGASTTTIRPSRARCATCLTRLAEAARFGATRSRRRRGDRLPPRRTAPRARAKSASRAAEIGQAPSRCVTPYATRTNDQWDYDRDQ